MLAEDLEARLSLLQGNLSSSSSIFTYNRMKKGHGRTGGLRPMLPLRRVRGGPARWEAPMSFVTVSLLGVLAFGGVFLLFGSEWWSSSRGALKPPSKKPDPPKDE